MSHYTGAVPGPAVLASDWLEFAVCKADADAMYPDTNAAGIAYAKRICSVCPVPLICLRDAIRTGDDQHGIRGGLKPEERRKVAALLNRDQLRDDTALQHAVNQVADPSYTRTMREVWDDRTHTLPDGHLGWTGGAKNNTVLFQGRVYTPKQFAFQVDRGHEPVGVVRRICDVAECVHPRHLADNVERHLAKVAAEQAEAVP